MDSYYWKEIIEGYHWQDKTMENYNWEEIKNLIIEREKYLICGPNVIHFQYFEGYISQRNIEDFENKLYQIGLALSRYRYPSKNLLCSSINKQPRTFILIAQPLIGELINADTVTEKWETIKYLMLTTRENLNENTNRNKPSELNKYELTFELKVNIDRNTSFCFIIQGGLNKESTQNSFDKILYFLREQKLNDKYKLAEYVYFEKQENKWVKLDIQKDILKILQRNDI